MKKVLNVTIDEKLWDELKKCAESENRTVSNLVETLLYKALSDK
jgi:predicted DNA-binding ribbon-helix-helix protein